MNLLRKTTRTSHGIDADCWAIKDGEFRVTATHVHGNLSLYASEVARDAGAQILENIPFSIPRTAFPDGVSEDDILAYLAAQPGELDAGRGVKLEPSTAVHVRPAPGERGRGRAR